MRMAPACPPAFRFAKKNNIDFELQLVNLSKGFSALNDVSIKQRKGAQDAFKPTTWAPLFQVHLVCPFGDGDDTDRSVTKCGSYSTRHVC
ncbi:hypothetical protein NDU88_002110 [Pleurodeles waltl]|uniref:Uncharacterized protein n=1 Tax=Pleurodeles waltl TaxID=8319 RepID=A0AAV7TM53_PLEWA|nr:hypothetical protein NDU88_002110 [Pleurodeles waltl]